MYEWNERFFDFEGLAPFYHGLRGGSWFDDGVTGADILAASSGGNYADTSSIDSRIGFRVASVPQPSSFMLAAWCLVGGLLGLRRPRGR